MDFLQAVSVVVLRDRTDRDARERVVKADRGDAEVEVQVE
jgi:hypothetical protein